VDGWNLESWFFSVSFEVFGSDDEDDDWDGKRS